MPVDNNNSNDNTNKPSEPKRSWVKKYGTSLFLLAATVLLINFGLLPNLGANRRQVPYSQFLEQVQADKVEQATIGREQIRYQLKEGATSESQESRSFETTAVPQDQKLVEILRQHNVEFTGSLSDTDDGGILGWLFMLFLFFGFWIWLLRRAAAGGGAGGPAALNVGKSKARIYSEGKTGVKFDDVAGVDEAKAELQEVIDFLKNSQKYTRLGAKFPKGILLIGPPGTGKTLLARAVAGEANVPFFSLSGSEFIELFVGVGASRVRDLFKQAKENAPCIVFIDELDALGKSRGGGNSMVGGSNDEREQTLNQLLNEMDGFEPNIGIILIAATNRPEVLDPALQRPGRFDRQVVVDRPDKIGRKAILAVHVPNVKLADDVDLEKLAIRTPGFAGADLANLVNEAALLAARQDQDTVTMADFNEAIERVIAGLKKKSRVLTDTEKKTVAYHETGHALVGSLIPGAGTVEKISIVPRGVGALGYTLQLPEEDRFLVGEDEIRGRIAIMLAGRSAEELIFGKVSTGASDDIQKATDMAERFVTIYGMSDKLGPIAFDKPQSQFLAGMGSPRRSVSPQVAEAIDQEVKAMVDGAHQMALKILDDNREILEQTAQVLLQEEVLEAQALLEKLDQMQRPKGLDEWLRTGKLPEHQELLPTMN
ncbi:MAG: ATP-dependent zinc metalloprotease FtsH [Coleofasciculus sp. B1-GNL1-01]|uniref:ATP-dependent zinc metalloprotease FtsH n=1 Tax=Coleofasciculus sp. B1-GNL1-01 TaxID=3068484 RepID=UPI0032FAF187